jgi:hypothetical protein
MTYKGKLKEWSYLFLLTRSYRLIIWLTKKLKRNESRYLLMIFLLLP